MTVEELLVDPAKVYTRSVVTVENVDVEKGFVDAKLIPYEVEADLGGGHHEVFSRGAFAAAVGNPSRCKLKDQQHGKDDIGKAVELRDEADGLYGTLRVSKTRAGMDVLQLLDDGVLEHMSIEFRPMARKFEQVRRGPDNFLIRHRQAELVGVSPVSAGAYGRMRGCYRFVALSEPSRTWRGRRNWLTWTPSGRPEEVELVSRIGSHRPGSDPTEWSSQTMTRVEEEIWREWGSLPEPHPAPVKEIARRLGLEPADVAFVVYPAETFGRWADDQEPDL